MVLYKGHFQPSIFKISNFRPFIWRFRNGSYKSVHVKLSFRLPFHCLPSSYLITLILGKSLRFALIMISSEFSDIRYSILFESCGQSWSISAHLVTRYVTWRAAVMTRTRELNTDTFNCDKSIMVLINTPTERDLRKAIWK